MGKTEELPWNAANFKLFSRRVKKGYSRNQLLRRAHEVTVSSLPKAHLRDLFHPTAALACPQALWVRGPGVGETQPFLHETLWAGNDEQVQCLLSRSHRVWMLTWSSVPAAVGAPAKLAGEVGGGYYCCWGGSCEAADTGGEREGRQEKKPPHSWKKWGTEGAPFLWMGLTGVVGASSALPKLLALMKHVQRLKRWRNFRSFLHPANGKLHHVAFALGCCLLSPADGDAVGTSVALYWTLPLPPLQWGPHSCSNQDLVLGAAGEGEQNWCLPGDPFLPGSPGHKGVLNKSQSQPPIYITDHPCPAPAACDSLGPAKQRWGSPLDQVHQHPLSIPSELSRTLTLSSWL